MLLTIKELHDYAIAASDGVIGQVKDVYLDDEAWVVRYLVVDAGSWLSSRKVLISPIGIGEPDRAKRLLPVSITKEQVRKSPDFDSEMPVTRQHEMEYSSYYGYPYYWGGMGYWGGGMYPNMMLSGYGGIPASQADETVALEARARVDASRHENADPHLRSCAAITGYHVHASDGDIGHVAGMLLDDATWAVRYLVVDTSNWWMGHKMLIAPPWIGSVNWEDRTVSVGLTRQAVKDSPTYDPAVSPTRVDEGLLYKHYGRSSYWANPDKRG
jgi:sporulation protein YlmC with PRC-barrel domain